MTETRALPKQAQVAFAAACRWRWSRALAAASILLATLGASVPARAVELLVSTHANSVVTPCGGVPNCLDAAVVGIANDYTGLTSPIPDAWTFRLNFRQINGAGTGTWSYTDLGPAGNNLFGTSTHALTPVSATLVRDSTQYVVLGGSGIFAGAVGTGQATAYIDVTTGNSVDSTVFSLTLMPVPEPAGAALMLAGLASIGALARRRRVAAALPAR